LDAFPNRRKVISKFIEEGPKHIILDLSKIDFVDSSGLGALVQLAKQAQSAGVPRNCHQCPRDPNGQAGFCLEKFLSLQPSVEAALENAVLSASWTDLPSYPVLNLDS